MCGQALVRDLRSGRQLLWRLAFYIFIYIYIYFLGLNHMLKLLSTSFSAPGLVGLARPCGEEARTEEWLLWPVAVCLLYTKCHSSQIRRSCQHDSGGPSHHAHGLCLHCLPNRQEMQIATACHLIQQVLIWLVLILGMPYGFVWYQYCNEENGHSHQYLDDRGCTSQGEFSTVCASTSKSGLCPSNVSGLRANHRQKRRWLHRVTRAPPKMCQSTLATYLAAMLNDPDVKFHTVTQ